MRICPINNINNNISFSANIIDSHCHIGKDITPGSDKVFSLDDLRQVVHEKFDVVIKGVKQTDEVVYSFVSSLSSIATSENGEPIADEITGNMDLLKQIGKNERFKALAVCQPGLGKAENMEKLLQDNTGKFFGLKFHPEFLGKAPDDIVYEAYLKLADKYKLPCVFHSDKLGSYADPNLIYEAAKKIPKVPVVLYHMSLAPGCLIKDLMPTDYESKKTTIEKLKTEFDDAIKQLEKEKKEIKAEDKIFENKPVWDIREHWNRDGIKVVKESIKNGDAKLYLEVSWTKPETVVEAIKTVGEDRVIFGTDTPFIELFKNFDTYYQERVQNIKNAIADAFPTDAERIIQKVFYDNSHEIFIAKKWAEEIQEKTEQKVQGPIEHKVPEIEQRASGSIEEQVVKKITESPPASVGGGSRNKLIVFGALTILAAAGLYKYYLAPTGDKVPDYPVAELPPVYPTPSGNPSGNMTDFLKRFNVNV